MLETADDLQPWFALDFTREEALAYRAAHCTDPQRTLDLRMVGITAEQMAACGMGRAYTDGDTSVAELLSVMLPEGESHLPY